MYLKYFLNDEGKRVYTLKSQSPEMKPTQSAHPARFSPGSSHSRNVEAKGCGLKKHFR